MVKVYRENKLMLWDTIRMNVPSKKKGRTLQAVRRGLKKDTRLLKLY